MIKRCLNQVGAGLLSFFLTIGLIADEVSFLPNDYRTNGRLVRRSAEELRGSILDSTVAIVGEDGLVSLGTRLDQGRLVITKLSLLPEEFQVGLGRDELVAGTLIHQESSLDLAAIRIDKGRDDSIVWMETCCGAIGDWVLAPRGRRSFRMGVISARERKIENVGGALGIQLEERVDQQVVVVSVFEESGAEKAGLERGDIIRSIDGTLIESSDALINLVRKHDAGDVLRLMVKRGDAVLPKEVTLSYRSVFDSEDRNQRMSGETSDRRTGFERVIQHSTPLRPEDMGGPVYALNGEVIGLNIARADRVTTFALPADLVNGFVSRSLRAEKEAKWNLKIVRIDVEPEEIELRPTYVSTLHRNAQIDPRAETLAWIGADELRGAFPIGPFLGERGIVNSQNGLFVHDSNAGYVVSYETDLAFEIHGIMAGNLVLRDDDGALWSALSGRRLGSEDSEETPRLKRRQSFLVPWEEWLMLHPESHSFEIPESMNQVVDWDRYKNGNDPLVQFRGDGRLEGIKQIVGIDSVGPPTAYVIPSRDDAYCLNLKIDEAAFTLFRDGSSGAISVFQSVVDGKRRQFEVDLGAPVSAPFIDRETKSRWTLSGCAVQGPLRGHRLEGMNAVICHWSAWVSEYPETELVELSLE